MSEIPESKKPREFWIYKGESNFCNELVMDNDFAFVKCKPDGFYDLISTKDTIENGLHVIEFSAYEQLQKQNKELIETLTDALEVTESLEDDMQHYFDNGCCPTISELNQVFSLTLRLKEVLAKYKKGDL